ncbi:hypothetical protein [Cytobacillus luteolus]|uniref:hypothetical protein n=1 Tax=Litchfieldia luteola TaxID=682179 RepID=UPI001AE386DA|nr:hypothetical protein [Cytobacillus luteolus]MBP1944654.1 hypothetical protein [Cytobacillus luteolus]
MKKFLYRYKLTRMNRQQLWMLMSFALYTENQDIVDQVHDEIAQRNFLGKR